MTMRWIVIALLVGMTAVVACAQDVRINLSRTASKTFELNKRVKIRVTERLYLSPRLERIDNDYDDFFTDIDLLPGTASTGSGDDDDDDDDDDDSANSNGSANNGVNQPLNDNANQLSAELRSATGLGAEWRMKKWLRLSTAYELYWRPGRFRHGLSTAVRLVPNLPFKKWALDHQLKMQNVGEQRRDEFRLSHGLYTQVRVQYKLTSNHRLYTAAGVNGDLEAGKLELDRFRWSTGLRYKFQDQHSFDFRYRYQSRIYKKNRRAHDLSFSYTIDF